MYLGILSDVWGSLERLSRGVRVLVLCYGLNYQRDRLKSEPQHREQDPIWKQDHYDVIT